MKELVISRKKWLRGEGNSKSKLLRSIDSKMCCLGFLAVACGAEDNQIIEVGAPGDLNCSVLWPNGILKERFVNSEITDILIDINDAQDCPESEREEEISRLFKELDIEVKFVD